MSTKEMISYLVFCYSMLALLFVGLLYVGHRLHVEKEEHIKDLKTCNLISNFAVECANLKGGSL